MAHISNPHNSQETEIGLPRVRDLSGLCTKTMLRLLETKRKCPGEVKMNMSLAKLLPSMQKGPWFHTRTPSAMKRKKRALIVCFDCLSSFGSPLLLDSEQEVPPGTTESVQSVDYYCDSEFKHDTLTFMLKVDLSKLRSLTFLKWASTALVCPMEDWSL